MTKEGRKIFEKTPATITASGAMHYLEAVWEFRGELFLCFLKAGQKCCALDADNLGNRLIGQTILTEYADLYSFRHEFVQADKELVELGLVADDLFNRRRRIGKLIV